MSGVAACVRTVQGVGLQLVLFATYELVRSGGLMMLVLVSLTVSDMFHVLRGARRPAATAHVLVRRVAVTGIIV